MNYPKTAGCVRNRAGAGWRRRPGVEPPRGPGITKTPKVDGTDFYMFRSYETGRAGLRHAARQLHAAPGCLRRPELLHAGPRRDLRNPRRQQRRRPRGPTFQFRFTQHTRRTSPCTSAARTSRCRSSTSGRIGPGRADTGKLNVIESYTVDAHPRRSPLREAARRSRNAATGERTFLKPVDRIGDKSIRDDANRSGRPNDVYHDMRTTTSIRSHSRVRGGGACSSVSAAKASS